MTRFVCWLFGRPFSTRLWCLRLISEAARFSATRSAFSVFPT
jgi:hypothetical protein